MRIIYKQFPFLQPAQIKAGTTATPLCTAATPLAQGFQGFVQTFVKPQTTLAELAPLPPPYQNPK